MRAVALIVALIVALGGTAFADDAPFTIGSRPAWLVFGGLTTGGTIALADRGAFVGGEMSVVRLRDANFVGIYADGYYDWGAHGTYATGGLELGHKIFGLDGGVALRFAGGQHDVGFAGRVTIGLGAAGIYARYARFGGAMAGENVLQIGLLLKLPWWTSGS